MIRFQPTPDSPLEIRISLDGVAVFLDQFAIKKLAKENPSRRLRFTQAMRSGGDLVFSVSNAVELTGPTGDSAEQIKAFLSGLGAHWFPVEMDGKTVSDREADMLASRRPNAHNPTDNFACTKFVKDFVADRIATQAKGELIDATPDRFFDLGWFVEKLHTQRESLLAGKHDIDQALRHRLVELRKKHDANPHWIDNAFPNLPFDSRFPITFTYSHLMRLLIAEAKSHQIIKNDGIDFCQAVVAPGITKMATLDKHWKRRVEKLPKPNRLARIYSENEIDALVDDFEKQVAESTT